MEKGALAPGLIPSSQHTSASHIGKEKSLSRASSQHSSQHEREKRVVETTPLDEAEASDNLSDTPEYPSGLKLGIIIASLSLSVFLMALVSSVL